MGIIKKMRRETAIYWAPDGLDGGLQPKVAEPVQIKCRWEQRAEQYFKEDGVEATSQAIVYTDRVVEVGGFLWLGILTKAPATPPPENRIERFENLPNLRATERLFTAYI